jgi:predicted alpha/beta-hydrolase family hydrolase
MRSVTTREVETPSGAARLHCDPRAGARAVLVLGHGAGGGVDTPDLTAAAAAARSAQVAVVRVEQPYRVAGRRTPPPAAHLDEAWLAVVDELLASDYAGLPLLAGGRSSGARVACRTASQAGARGVLCLAFPLHPPPRRSATAGQPASRLAELDQVTVPTLVVQGERDPFGIPPPAPARTVAQVPGDHSLRADPDSVTTAVRRWLASLRFAVQSTETSIV